ncbi:hypothetical protein CJ179_36540 [Rhodococcus sp. ACS1]|uniref:protein phosphatase 2C domain-containing protein n=1 Tax=Rhodococcus sp. ACS1 TaxID=2028570 RepID=UPI000BB10610|nr:protein phosphatase 2C domain-containing protein [Rhodococcus sp. ACS1]PBC39527.1 hypothetical protein CJ179_36540 [Rhodococcus sp. ACS1]
MGHRVSQDALADDLSALPEPYTIGDPGRSYGEIGGNEPLAEPAPPDTVCDAFDFGGWAVRAASVRGLSHRYDGSVRQDAYAVRYSAGTGRLVVAVCDGVGSAPHSHVAAAAAADFLVDELVGVDLEVSEPFWTGLFRDASEHVNAVARRHGVKDGTLADVRNLMATTALVAVIDTAAEDNWTVTCAGVGDSSLWLGRTDRSPGAPASWSALLGGKTPSTDVTSTTTSALPISKHTAVEPLQVILESAAVLLLCSDGIGDALGDGTNQVARTLGDQWASPPTALNFAAQASFGKRGLFDDRTGIAIWSPRP